jgi:hypothetical protein
MSIFDDITWKDWIFLFIIILLVTKIWQMERACERIERFDGNGSTLSNEAIQNIASVYNQGELTVSKLNVTGDLMVNGKSTLKGQTTANNVPSLTVGSFTANNNATIKGNLINNGSATVKGDLINDGSATFKKGVHISGKHKTDDTALTIADPSGANSNTHFYYQGNKTYLGGSDALIVRTKKAPSGRGDRVLLSVGGGKPPGYYNVMNPTTYRKKYMQTSDYAAPLSWRYRE